MFFFLEREKHIYSFTHSKMVQLRNYKYIILHCKCKVEIRSSWSSHVVDIVLHHIGDRKVDSPYIW